MGKSQTPALPHSEPPDGMVYCMDACMDDVRFIAFGERLLLPDNPTAFCFHLAWKSFCEGEGMRMGGHLLMQHALKMCFISYAAQLRADRFLLAKAQLLQTTCTYMPSKMRVSPHPPLKAWRLVYVQCEILLIHTG